YKTSANLYGTDADKAAITRLDQLAGALTAAQLELTNAAAARDAAQAMLADPQKVAQLIEANRSKGIFAGLDQQKTQVEADLAAAQQLAQRQSQSMSPQHPKVLETQRTITNLKAKLAALEPQYGQVYGAYLEQQRLTAQRKVDELKTLIDEQSKLTKDYAAKSAKLAELEAALKSADAALAEVNGKLRDQAVGNGGGSSPPALRIVQPAQIPRQPSHPDRVRVLSTALLIGLVAGFFLASIGKSSR